MKPQSKFLLFIFLMFVAFACEKVEYVDKIVEKEYSWKKDDRIQFEDNVILNMHANRDYLYALTPFVFTTISASGSLPPIYINTPVLRYPHNGNLSFYYRYPINDDLLLLVNDINSYDKSIIKLWSTSEVQNYSRGLHYQYPPVAIDMVKLDKYFFDFNFSSYQHNDCIALGEKGFCLIPYRIKPYSRIFNKYALVKTQRISINNIDGNTYYHIDTLYTKTVLAPQPEYLKYLDMISFVNDRFFINTNMGLEYIDTLGNTGIITNDISFKRIFKVNAALYAIGFMSGNGWNYLKSNNNGQSWDIIGPAENDLQYLNFSTPNDTLIIGTYHGQLFSFKLYDNGYAVKELDNEGLEDKQITSFAIFKDTLAYVSTFSGLYYKSIKDLMREKKVEEGSR